MSIKIGYVFAFLFCFNSYSSLSGLIGLKALSGHGASQRNSSSGSGSSFNYTFSGPAKIRMSFGKRKETYEECANFWGPRRSSINFHCGDIPPYPKEKQICISNNKICIIILATHRGREKIFLECDNGFAEQFKKNQYKEILNFFNRHPYWKCSKFRDEK